MREERRGAAGEERMLCGRYHDSVTTNGYDYERKESLEQDTARYPSMLYPTPIVSYRRIGVG